MGPIKAQHFFDPYQKMNDFYVTLPSSSQNSQFKNTSSRYVTRLPEVLNLERDKYVVAATDIIYPYSFLNVGRPLDYWIHFNSKRKPVHVTFPKAQYSDTEQILNTLNDKKLVRQKRNAVQAALSEELTRIKRAKPEDAGDNVFQEFDELTAQEMKQKEKEKQEIKEMSGNYDSLTNAAKKEVGQLGVDHDHLENRERQIVAEDGNNFENLKQKEDQIRAATDKMDQQVLNEFGSLEVQESQTTPAPIVVTTQKTTQTTSPATTQRPVTPRPTVTTTPRPIVVTTQKPVKQTTQKPAQTLAPTTPRPTVTTPRPAVVTTQKPVKQATQKPAQTLAPTTPRPTVTTPRPAVVTTQKPVKQTTQKPAQTPAPVTATPRPTMTTVAPTPVTTTQAPTPVEFLEHASLEMQEATARGATTMPTPTTTFSVSTTGTVPIEFLQHQELEIQENNQMSTTAPTILIDEFQKLGNEEKEFEDLWDEYIVACAEVASKSAIESVYRQNLEELKQIRAKMTPTEIVSSRELLEFEEQDGRVHVKFLSSDVYFVEFDEPCAYFLGFADTIVRKNTTALNKVDFFGNVSTLYLYCDVVDPIIVGNTKSSLLSVIPCRGSYGEMIHYTVAYPRYLPLMNSTIDSIRIELLSEFDEPIHFHWGSTIIVLHFKKLE